MDQESLWRELSGLPPEAQRQVGDFIAFLRARHRRSRPVKKPPPTSLAEETFIGIWRDREDMRDSRAWVRDVREREWVRSRA
jgi:hypothetical protein